MYPGDAQQRGFRLLVDLHWIRTPLTGTVIRALLPSSNGLMPGLSSAIGRYGAVAGSRSTPGDTSRTLSPAPQAVSSTSTTQ